MIDIFDLIKKVEKFDHNYYNQLSDDDKKQVSFFLLQRWLSCTDNPKQILYLNRFVNQSLYNINHNELIYKLFCCCVDNKNGNYKWIKKSSKRKNSILQLIMTSYTCGMHEAEEILSMLTISDILELCDESNLDKITIDKIKKEVS